MLGVLAACGSTQADNQGTGAPNETADDSAENAAQTGPKGATSSSSSSGDASSTVPPAANFCSDPTGGQVSLPDDDAAHTAEKMEWWYWTGHLQTAEGRWFGFEEVFFRVKVLGAPGHMVHSALTDIDGNAFHHYAAIRPGELPVKPGGFDFSEGDHSVKGGKGHDSLAAKGDGYALNLDLSTTKRATLQHGSGYTDYSFGGYTYYYSRERMDVQGTITLDGDVLPVTGTGWFDHQYGDIDNAVNHGWDWFAFQLDDHRQMMLFLVRVHGEQILVGASVTTDGCETIEVPADQVAVTSLGEWQSPHTSCTYPAGWTVKVADETFTVEPYVADQEVSTSVPIYWEGASSVKRDGVPVGRAYVELSGYCPALP